MYIVVKSLFWFSPFHSFLGLNVYRNPFSESWLFCSLHLIPAVKHKTYLLWGSGLPRPFNIKYKKDMSFWGWQFTVGNHIRWSLHCCVCLSEVQRHCRGLVVMNSNAADKRQNIYALTVMVMNNDRQKHVTLNCMRTYLNIFVFYIHIYIFFFLIN